jgi:hypothetical protein
VIAVSAPEFFARRRARQEVDAIRVALTVEAQRLVEIMIETHSVLLSMLGSLMESGISGVGAIARAEMERSNQAAIAARSIGRTLGELREPVVYPACADRIGLLGARLAEGVVGFYGNYERLQFLGRIIFNDRNYTPAIHELAPYIIKFEEVCANGLPLFEQLPVAGMREPIDLGGLKAKVEGMAEARKRASTA